MNGNGAFPRIGCVVVFLGRHVQKSMFLLALAFGASGAFGGELVAGFRGYATNFVAEGQTSVQRDRIIAGSGGRICKTGKGAWTVPLDTLDQANPSSFLVKEGTLAFSTEAGGATVGARPDAILAKAALWLDATKNVETASAGGVAVWRDARESSGATSYCFGVAETRSGYPLSGQNPVCTEYDGRTALYFGGVGSGQYMNLCDATGADKDIRLVCHTFVVHAVDQTFGEILGGYQRPTDFRPGASTIYENGGNDTFAAFTGRTYVNGDLVNGYTTAPRKGFWLLETELIDPLAHVQALFTDANANKDSAVKGFRTNWQGGDYVSEIILFTNRLTQVERLQVQAYLMDRWNLKAGLAPVGVKVAKGASFTADDAVASVTAIDLAGEGRLAWSGTGSLTLASPEGRAFAGEVEMNGGSLATRGARPFAFKASAGAKVTAAVTDQGYAFTRGTAGADTFVKDGNAELTLRETPGDVKRIQVNAGVLALSSADLGETLVPGAATDVPVPNGDFEAPLSGNQSFNRYRIGAGQTKFQWTEVPAKGSATSDVGIDSGVLNANYAVWYMGDSLCGKQALFLGGGGGVYTHVTLPQDGEYELGCYVSTRADYKQNARLDVMMGATWETAEQVGTLYCEARAWQWRVARLPRLSAGDYVLGLRLSENDEEFHENAAVDGIRLTLVSEPQRAPAYRIPNGDFESVLPSHPRGLGQSGGNIVPYYMSFWDVSAHPTAGSSDHSVRDNLKVSPVNGWVNNYFVNATDLQTHLRSEGWTLSKTGWLTTANEQPIEFTCSTTPFTQPYDPNVDCHGSPNQYVGPRGISCYDAAGTSYGGVNLMFASTGGLATTTFTPPPGRYQLRCRAAQWVATWNCSYFMGTVPQIRARTKVNGVSTDLGTIGPNDHAMRDYVWPFAFTVSAGESVTLELSNETALGMAITDDFVLDRADIVANGGFERDSDWIYEAHTTDNNGTMTTWSCGRFVNAGGAPYGWSRYEGSAYARITRLGRISQQVTLAAGEYRLKFHTFGRYALNAWGKTSFEPHFGQQTLEVDLVRNGVTNALCVVPTYTTNFVEHATTFSIAPDDAGAYDLVFRGLVDDDKMAHLDGVSITSVENASASTPDIDPKTALDVAAGAKVLLEFPGQLKLDTVRLGGKSVTGVLSAKTHPDWFLGTGTLYVSPKGTVVLIR